MGVVLVTKWITEESAFEGDPNNDVQTLKFPSGMLLRATRILGRVHDA